MARKAAPSNATKPLIIPNYYLHPLCLLSFLGIVLLSLLRKYGSAERNCIRTRGNLHPESIRIRIPLFSGSASAFIWELGAAAEFLRFSEVSGSARSGIAGATVLYVVYKIIKRHYGSSNLPSTMQYTITFGARLFSWPL
ncbi:hypothetical protein L873DRAFT_902135 [Choiromyces venosus 120613-1]|uniref:Uncharacterized protein n=1 Tax=Choiromyces venosus 120613-1 TaxID=1336337 RepID=A0A3N4JMF3_9PEZI|nr:hypothetical protein L873DRAFT_902135 [Choiromyces venosus 120613-1]